MSHLKKEARKQTKQKLRALEANLLNQIKVNNLILIVDLSRLIL